jgi:hypothetical protein
MIGQACQQCSHGNGDDDGETSPLLLMVAVAVLSRRLPIARFCTSSGM